MVFKGHYLAGARHFSLGHQKSHGNFNVKKISDYTNSTLLILLRPLISFYLVASQQDDGILQLDPILIRN